jgi:hypothetical protein
MLSKISPTEFEVSCSMTRSSTVTAYVIEEIINGTGASILPTLDFSAICGATARKIQINSAQVISSNGATSLPLIARLFLCNVNNPQTVTDYAPFNPSAAVLASNLACVIDDLSSLVHQASSAYILQQNEIQRNATLDANGHLYPCLLANNAYVPASGETISITIKGYLL